MKKMAFEAVELSFVFSNVSKNSTDLPEFGYDFHHEKQEFKICYHSL